MAEVTGITAAKAQEIHNASIVSGSINESGQLILQTRGGEQINAGPIIAPTAALEKAYPVGSIYINTVNTNPAELLGIGTWTRFANGRTLVGVDENQTEFDQVLETGGAKTVTLTAAQLPSHNHTVPNHTHSILVEYASNGQVGGSAHRITDVASATGGGGGNKVGQTGGSGSFTTGSAGSGQAHNNLQPYITVYMWRRTA